MDFSENLLTNLIELIVWYIYGKIKTESLYFFQENYNPNLSPLNSINLKLLIIRSEVNIIQRIPYVKMYATMVSRVKHFP